MNLEHPSQRDEVQSIKLVYLSVIATQYMCIMIKETVVVLLK